MTPRDVIIRNLELRDPERIGMSFSAGRMRDFCSGGMGPSATWTQKRWTEGEMEFNDDEWGNVWYRIEGMSAKGEIYEPALKDWAMLKDYQLPDLAHPARYQKMRQTLAQQPDHYRLGGLGGFPFAICRYLRKMEVYFEDLILERDNIDLLHEKVTILLEQVMERLAEAGADGVFFCEDWGIQDRLLISPPMWRDIFKPIYRRLCAKAHSLNLHVLMHSCGYNWDILDDLAEVGVNAFQFDQPGLYGLERLAEKLQSRKVCLFAPVDIQKVLPTGDRALIEAEAERMVRLFGAQHGGLIAKNYGDLHGIGVQPEWDQWAYDTFLRCRNLPAS
ncbi:MAG: uroporphyrinogen decarboxylase family protein [Kiritimatiellia bacterium]